MDFHGRLPLTNYYYLVKLGQPLSAENFIGPQTLSSNTDVQNSP